MTVHAASAGACRPQIQDTRMTDIPHKSDGAEVLPMEPRVHDDGKAAVRPLRVALVGTFAPQKCGIATFTTDVYEQFRQFQRDVTIDLYVLRDPATPGGEGEQQHGWIDPDDA